MPKKFSTFTRTTDYELNYVKPLGLEKGTYYIIHQDSALRNTRLEPWDDHEFTRLAVCIQGLVNRNFDSHGVAVEVRRDPTDDFWRDYITRDGAVYHAMKKVEITTPEQFFEVFMPFIKAQGLVIWDKAVPSTANVASTVCGIDGFLPVQNDEVAGGLYDLLVNENGAEIKLDFTGMFQGGVKNKTVIAGTNIPSCGSAKCDAYLWALEKYFPKCNPWLLAYTLDGMTSRREDKQYDSTCYGNNNTGIPNHDYFIRNQMFFFDLITVSLFPATDDPSQPRCTDFETVEKILKARYERVNGEWGIVVGFPPWNIKYCHFPEDPPRCEWHMVETFTALNCGLEADAPGPCFMFNGSLYANYQLLNEIKENQPVKNIKYDSGKKYWSILFSGEDQDCSPWTKKDVPVLWNDPNLGKVSMPFCYNLNLIDRIPMVFDYIQEKRNDNCYVTGHEGYSYTIPAMLFKGRTGRECNPYTRTLPDGDKEFLKAAMPYFEKLKITSCNRTINGFTPISAPEMRVMAKQSPDGVIMEESGMNRKRLMTCGGVPFMMVLGVHGRDINEKVNYLYNLLNENEYGLVPLIYGTNPTEVTELVTEFEKFIAEKGESDKYVFTDPRTFMQVVKDSGLGEKAD